MKILQINWYDMFSTGNIMLNIAKVARNRKYIAWTASKKMKMSLDMKRKDNFHFYIGSRTEHTLHRYFSWCTDFQDCGSVIATLSLIRKIKRINPDIIHLHDIVGWYVNIDILFHFLKKMNKPLVWTFHDCWAFTGRCIYFDAVGCNRWKTGCGNCPQRDYMPKSWFFDLSSWNWKRKKRLFSSVENMTIVTPSSWLKDLVNESFLSGYSVKVINNGINLGVFKPTQGEIYEKIATLGKKVILGVAAVWSTRKGLSDFIRLSKELSNDYIIVLVGLSQEEIGDVDNIIAIERTNNQFELAQIYSVADVFVNPTIEDNFPTVNLESLACGTPIVTYNAGGSPESVTNETGIVVEKGDYEGLKDAIFNILEKGKSFYTLSCILSAKKYDMNKCFDDYVNLYEEIKNT